MKPTFHRVFAVLGAAVPVIAAAHPGHAETATFKSGFFHPLLGVDHILAAVAVDLLAARSKTTRRWMLPAVFVACMLMAFGLARATPAWPMTEWLIAISLFGLGAAYFSGHRAPRITATLVALFGAVHGFVHGTELPGEGSWQAE
ncbi:MAG: HupE/UreJ family protein [Betaproteobacteria bacterium]